MSTLYSLNNGIELPENIHITGSIIVDQSLNAATVNAPTINTNTINTTNIELSGNVYINQNLLIPTGTIVQFAGSSAPGGWLLCQGQSVSKTSYSACGLF